MNERLIVAQRSGEVVRGLGKDDRVDDGWEPVEQIDGVVMIPDGVTIIAESAFILCDMTRVFFPDSIRHIGPFAFSNCKHLRTIRLPETYETIGWYSFHNVDLEGDIPAFPLGRIDDPRRTRILGDSAFSKYWEKNGCCPVCGYELDSDGICMNCVHHEKPRLTLFEGISLCNMAMTLDFQKCCTPDGDTRLSENHGLDFEAMLSEKAYEMNRIRHETNASWTIEMPQDFNHSHSLLNSSWAQTMMAKVSVKNRKATVRLPFLMDTPERRKIIKSAFGLIPDNGIADVSFVATFGPSVNGRLIKQESVSVAKTDMGGVIRVCDHCRCVKEPHFCYQTPSGRDLYFDIQRNEPCDYPLDFPMEYRWDLQISLSHNDLWYNIIQQWNQNNKPQVSLSQHIPFYVDARVKPQYGGFEHSDSRTLKGSKLYVETDDEDPRPHFHYRHADGSEAMICFGKTEYLEPSVHLTASQKEDLVRYLRKTSGVIREYGDNNYGEMLTIWMANPDHRLVPSEQLKMPDYMLLPE